MAKPQTVGLGDWNQMVGHFHGESDRGAAILAGSFAEHALGTFLIDRVANTGLAEKLFGPVGPLSSFSQRIAVAYAFGQITERQYKDFEAIRQARNHFAHHPLDASFASQEVKKHVAKTSMYNDKEAMEQHKDGGRMHRIAYLLTCGILCGNLLDKVGREKSQSDKVAR
jgi:hypothetical protein